MVAAAQPRSAPSVQPVLERRLTLAEWYARQQAIHADVLVERFPVDAVASTEVSDEIDDLCQSGASPRRSLVARRKTATSREFLEYTDCSAVASFSC